MVFAIVVVAVTVAGCRQVEQLRDVLRHQTPYEAYEASLRTAGLDETALGRAWLEAGTRALEAAVPVTLPYREVGYLDPAEPGATGYRIDLRRGQQLVVEADVQQGDSTRLFVDLFEVPADSARAPWHVASADSTRRLAFTARRDRAYLLRLQPELLRGGRFTVTLQARPSLLFPVAGHDSGSIRSYFGAPRDGGRRRHHGVDIFAARGTPVLAAADGYVTRVTTGGLGGKVVWQRDAHGHALYYAHLDSQIVQPSTRVQAGDTLGLVGNTGNARTTPPHLHFGIYNDGPVDPFPFLHAPRTRPPDVTADTSRLGQWVRVAEARATLSAGPEPAAPALRALPRHTIVRVEGGYAGWYRVALPDGTRGYVAARATEPARVPLRRTRLDPGRRVYGRPVPSATAIDTLAAGVEAPVLGGFDAYVLVRAPSGRVGWIIPD